MIFRVPNREEEINGWRSNIALDENVIDLLDSFSDKFPDTIVIESKQIEAILEKSIKGKRSDLLAFDDYKNVNFVVLF